MGLWHEVARLPSGFQRNCDQSIASYELRSNGKVGVRNQYLRNGQTDTAEGVAWVVGPEPSKLRVRFFWPFFGAYWIIALDPDYQWSMVGHPSRNHLWILARTGQLEAETLGQLKRHAATLGYDLESLIVTQP
jgi:apolipoprotein D and lipocalin family protein